MVPGTILCKCGGTWYQRLGYRYQAHMTRYQYKFRPWMILEFLEQIFSFYSADSDTDASVTCSGVVWSCSLVSRDLLSEFAIFMIAPSHKNGGTNTFNLGGTWYLMSWYRYQRPPCHPTLIRNLRLIFFEKWCPHIRNFSA